MKGCRTRRRRRRSAAQFADHWSIPTPFSYVEVPTTAYIYTCRVTHRLCASASTNGSFPINGSSASHKRPFRKQGAPDAEHVVVIMGSGAVTMSETVHYMTQTQGKKVGVLKVRKRDLFIDNLLVRIHLIIKMILVDRPCAMGL